MKKQSEALMGIKVILACSNRPRTIIDITRRVYGNLRESNIGRVYKLIDFLVTEKIMSPKMNNGNISFQVDKDVFKELVG